MHFRFLTLVGLQIKNYNQMKCNLEKNKKRMKPSKSLSNRIHSQGLKKLIYTQHNHCTGSTAPPDPQAWWHRHISSLHLTCST